MARAISIITILAATTNVINALGEAAAAHNLRECPREKSENLGIVANREVCVECKKKAQSVCKASECELRKEVPDPLEGIFIKPDFVGCDSRQSTQCNNRGIEGWVRIRLKKNCVMRNKAKRYDFTVHIKIPEKKALPVTRKSKIRVHGLPENNTKAWLSPLGEEIIFNINDISWKDLAVFKGLNYSDAKHDLIVERGFSIAPLNQNPRGFRTAWFQELNFARNGTSEIIKDDQSAFFICKQDHVLENIVTVAFWHQRIFTGIYFGKTAHFITYKMAAVLGSLVLFSIMMCLVAALLTLKKQASLTADSEIDEEEKPLIEEFEAANNLPEM